jgi:acetyl/propionyl-CoA carboxylase alpha subunit
VSASTSRRSQALARPSLRKDEGPPFPRLLVANRGEIALRVIRACRELGVETVAVYSDADADATHVRAADVAVRLGPAPATESYLRADAIIDAALATGASAIHPGYGFLAERAVFAEAVETAGLVFVGPTPAAIASLGDKLAARRTAASVGVPVVPGTLEPLPVDRANDIDAIVADAMSIGFPLFVKAAAGGGGRGMRRVASPRELPEALAAGSAEALSAFGDGSVYLEREIRPARHIEVQLVGDRFGEIVALGERDCSIQRRHQKLIEESPAPGLSRDERAALHELAVRAASAARLHNAATAEFLLDEDRRPWFLEVNARLQVEHGVTELVADVDLVHEQLWIAAGRSLSDRVRLAASRAIDPERHAIEVRLSAEDPARDFAPGPGRIGTWIMPAGPGVRVDTAIVSGERVTGDYDPMIAKIMVVAADRPAAIARLRRALDETIVTGLQTTLPFHRVVAAAPAFLAGVVSTDWVADRWDGASHRRAALDRAVAAAAGAAAARIAAPADGPVSVRKDAPLTGRVERPDQRPAGSAWREAGRRAGTDRWPR